ncbi:ribosomal protein Mrp49 [Schizosaccharomyces japonicus yFS275]|uniref:Ribosomal protein Mrp49 n=1 Tax=Schizosaccharomyces japonicus (strain yFS275 / FY16936) TaxID=402676 RepID=B6K2P0_SCHJY|nr:ribosomal protein Mrp49 [Schizosaccharomyces japonicus yFS275]EEB07421.1 ribosomal protein Mrp49 [Schizosaccharomyces japonicus yFS275]
MAVLNNVRNGALAIKFPKEITKVELSFARDSKNGHMGSRKFCFNDLPSLYYHNYKVKFDIKRHTENSESPVFRLFKGNTCVYSLDLQNKRSDDITVQVRNAIQSLKQTTVSKRSDDAM